MDNPLVARLIVGYLFFGTFFLGLWWKAIYKFATDNKKESLGEKALKMLFGVVFIAVLWPVGLFMSGEEKDDG